jgi:phosphatidylserine/phosphatidylglycerophosphate/cardiolipin synthase-like enzyme
MQMSKINVPEFKPLTHRPFQSALAHSWQQTMGRGLLVLALLHTPLVLAQALGSSDSMVMDPQALSRAEVVGLYFTPPSDIASAVVQVIASAKREVLVQAYGFTHIGIAQALVGAHQRGVEVKVLLDQKSESTNRLVVELFQSNHISLRFDGSHAIAHNKVMVIDGQVVITGSFNFTQSAQSRNAENLLVLRSEELANNYKQNWLTHWAHSR